MDNTWQDRRRLKGAGMAKQITGPVAAGPGGGHRCGTVCHRKHRRQILRGHAAMSTSARRPGGRIDRGRATGLPVAPIRLRRRERTDGPRTPADLREDPRTRNDVQDADESLASWTRHRIGVRQRHRRRISGGCVGTATFGGWISDNRRIRNCVRKTVNHSSTAPRGAAGTRHGHLRTRWLCAQRVADIIRNDRGGLRDGRSDHDGRDDGARRDDQACGRAAQAVIRPRTAGRRPCRRRAGAA